LAGDSICGRIRPGAAVLLALAGLLIITATVSCQPAPAEPVPMSALESILKAGEITVITWNTTHCYYRYDGRPMGFEYDLAKAFADYLGVRLKVHVADSWEGMIPALADNPRAFIAAGLTVTPGRSDQVAFSDGYLTIQQHIITNRYERQVKTPGDLDGKTVQVRSGTSYQHRLEQLRGEGIDVRIVPRDNIPTDELIRLVSEGKIELTVADSHIARLNRLYYPNAVVGGTISDEQILAWAVQKNAPALLGQINRFLKKIRESGWLKTVYDRYYGVAAEFDYPALLTFHRNINRRLKRYRPIIRQAASANQFDWRLIAAQIYQESHFNPKAESHAGAQGLMQLTPDTAKSFGLSDPLDPEQNIGAGVRHLRELYDHYDKAPDPDRLYIALAAYNIGLGHIHDARDIARQLHLDPNSWASLKRTLPLLGKRDYYRHTRYGYARGTEPVVYVRRILAYYDILRHMGVEREKNAMPSAVNRSDSARDNSRTPPAEDEVPAVSAGDQES